MAQWCLLSGTKTPSLIPSGVHCKDATHIVLICVLHTSCNVLCTMCAAYLSYQIVVGCQYPKRVVGAVHWLVAVVEMKAVVYLHEERMPSGHVS